MCVCVCESAYPFGYIANGFKYRSVRYVGFFPFPLLLLLIYKGLLPALFGFAIHRIGLSMNAWLSVLFPNFQPSRLPFCNFFPSLLFVFYFFFPF